MSQTDLLSTKTSDQPVPTARTPVMHHSLQKTQTKPKVQLLPNSLKLMHQLRELELAKHWLSRLAHKLIRDNAYSLVTIRVALFSESDMQRMTCNEAHVCSWHGMSDADCIKRLPRILLRIECICYSSSNISTCQPKLHDDAHIETCWPLTEKPVRSAINTIVYVFVSLCSLLTLAEVSWCIMKEIGWHRRAFLVQRHLFSGRDKRRHSLL